VLFCFVYGLKLKVGDLVWERFVVFIEVVDSVYVWFHL